MTRSRDSRRAAARARERSSRSRLWLPLVGIAVVLVAALGAIVLTSGSGDTGSSAPPSGLSTPPPGASGPVASGGASTGAPVISGAPLPTFTQTTGDPAIGQTIPTVEGADFAGQPVSITLDGKPKVILFLAHWCVHCQTEVPLVQAWLDGGGGPADVEVISVATGIDASLPNYPPDEWLEGEGWTVPVIVDPTNTVANAYGLASYPFFVFVNADGTVKGRLSGELPIADLETILASLAR